MRCEPLGTAVGNNSTTPCETTAASKRRAPFKILKFAMRIASHESLKHKAPFPIKMVRRAMRACRSEMFFFFKRRSTMMYTRRHHDMNMS